MIKSFFISTFLVFSYASTIAADEKTCCYNIRASASALYWQAQEEGLDYMVKNFDGAAIIDNGKIVRAEFDWDFGFRVGLGYDDPCKCIELDVQWTRFYTEGKDSVAAAFPEALFPVWTNPNANLSDEQQANAKITLHLNKLDFRAGSTYSPNCFISITPHVGIDVLWIDQKFSINANDGVSNGQFALVIDDAISMTNDFWGVGPAMGFNLSYNLGCGLFFFGNIDLAILYGHFDITQNETVLFTEGVPETTYLDINDNCFYLSRPNLALMIGLRWERCFCNRYDLTVDAGWEQQYFFGQNQLMRFVDDTNSGINIPVSGDLSVQGLTLRVGFSF